MQQNTFGWSPNLGGGTEQQYARNAWYNQMKWANQLANFNSPFHQSFAAYANKATPATGIGSYLSMLQAGGGNYAGSMAQAMQLKKAEDARRRDSINNMLTGYASNMAGQVGGMLGNMGNIGTSLYSTKTQEEIADSQQGGFLDILGAGLPFALMQIPSLFASGGASAIPAIASMSDIRLKENISYTGEETKDGIPIAEFNFKGDDRRYKGVIAQDVEKIRPDAVIEIDGIKHVYYGRL